MLGAPFGYIFVKGSAEINKCGLGFLARDGFASCWVARRHVCALQWQDAARFCDPVGLVAMALLGAHCGSCIGSPREALCVAQAGSTLRCWVSGVWNWEVLAG